MPLLLCPNDNVSMQSVNRAGVEFDMCPTCRGVWLDRGELEKLMSLGREDDPASAAPTRPAASAPHQAPYPAPPPSYGHYGERGERGEHGERGEYGERGGYGHGQPGHRRKRGFDLFDIFD